MKIYIVFGSKGEYSDRQEWPVMAYSKKESAEEMIVKCTEEGNRLRAKYDNYFDWRWPNTPGEGPAEPHALDPDFGWDSSGFNYYIEECELVND